MFSVLSRFSLSLQATLARSISTATSPLYFRITNTLLGEPLKKKKRIDPAVIKQREERKKRKLEKQIRRLEKSARQLKPIEEVQPAFKLIDEKERRMRQLPPLSFEVEEERELLFKDWARYKQKEHLADLQMVDTVLYSQQKALDELRAESEELYQAAIQCDDGIVPHTVNGPAATPAIEDYYPPDGQYLDVSRKW